MGKLRPGARTEAHPLGHDAVGVPAQVGIHLRGPAGQHGQALGVRRRGLQQGQQRQADGLEDHFIGHRAALAPQGRACLQAQRAAGRPPFGAVKLRQHRPTKVQGRGRWHRALEADAKGDAVVVGQIGHLAQPQCAGQAGAAHSVLRQAPQRPDARKEQEQRGHQRQAEQCRAGGEPGGAPQGRLADRHAGQDLGRQQTPGGHRHRQPDQQRLRIQALRERQEEAEEEHHQRITAPAQLQHLQRQQHHQHGHAGLLAQQAALGEHGEPGGHQHHGDHRGTARQGAIGERDPGAPEQQHRGERGAPAGQVGGVGQDGPAHHAKLEQRIA